MTLPESGKHIKKVSFLGGPLRMKIVTLRNGLLVKPITAKKGPGKHLMLLGNDR